LTVKPQKSAGEQGLSRWPEENLKNVKLKVFRGKDIGKEKLRKPPMDQGGRPKKGLGRRKGS